MPGRDRTILVCMGVESPRERQNPAAIVLRCRMHRHRRRGPGVTLTFRPLPSRSTCPDCRMVQARDQAEDDAG
ncbi:hypothetical protein FRACA_170026 [Frankia canadensis]|uniref:Uncharacterized protein n=1 Tax=Frankia canadensis TaxID=1836972 RepID=A0A2I2KN32_9ACTN|nr:hypothetical protein FRACA_170026 [Frankia canadensis]SOU54356.1 hypothetical protein FRACA_170026 [Frankia canadensis]